MYLLHAAVDTMVTLLVCKNACVQKLNSRVARHVQQETDATTRETADRGTRPRMEFRAVTSVRLQAKFEDLRYGRSIRVCDNDQHDALSKLLLEHAAPQRRRLPNHGVLQRPRRHRRFHQLTD
jgi:hypothetical protein